MRIIVLFNLKPGADAAAYEQWARGTDIPGVRALGSVADLALFPMQDVLDLKAAGQRR